MQPLNTLIKERTIKKSSFTSERQELIASFVERINFDRKGSKYPPVKWSGINFQLSHLKRLSDLYWLLQHCSKATCTFSQAFYFSLKKT